MDYITEQIVALRKVRDEIDEEEEKVKKLKEKKAQIEQDMFAWWNTQDLETRNKTYAAGTHGKVTFKIVRTFSIADRVKFDEWMNEKKMPHDVVYAPHHKKVNKFCKECLESGELPKGVESYEVEQIALRRS